VLLGDVGAALYVHDPEGGIGENILSNLPVDSTIALMVRWAMACVSSAPISFLFCEYTVLISCFL
jgi:hypothetical protein